MNSSRDGDSKRQASALDTRRRFEQWANNPLCGANSASAILNIPMRDVVAREGGRPNFGQSPFALARGRGFEARILQNNGAVLHQALVAEGVIRASTPRLHDLRLRQNGGPIKTLDEALSATKSWMETVSAGRSDATIAAGPTVRIPGGAMIPHATLCIDAVAVSHSTSHIELIVGEIKVYPDRGGYTDPSQLATSRAQSGMYVHALRLLIAELGLESNLHVSSKGFLVLSKSGTNQIRVRSNEDLEGQARRAMEGLKSLSERAEKLVSPENHSPSAVSKEPIHYTEGCMAFCERASICREKAESCGVPSILGDDVARFLEGVSLERVTALSKGALPGSEHEREILSLLKSVKEPSRE